MSRSAIWTNDARRHDAAHHEGERTAAKRLVRRLRETYGRWIDVIVAAGLYANGPFLTLLKELHLGGVIVAKKEGDEPLKEALTLWAGKPPEQVVEDDEAYERVELWTVASRRSTPTRPIRHWRSHPPLKTRRRSSRAQ
jgi:hypothetical protein